MMKMSGILATLIGLSLVACNDDPTDPRNGQTQTVFDVQADRIETFEDVDIHVRVDGGGGPLQMEHGEMHVDGVGGSDWMHEMEAMGDGWVAHAMFFEPGIHQLHFQGRRHGGGDENFGEHMVEVHRQHRLIGDYWAELSFDPAPIVAGTEATVTLTIFEIDGQSPGAPATGLTLVAHLHDPNDVESPVSFVEGTAGTYEVTYTFDDVGLYELHVTIGTDEGLFHFPVFASLDDIGTRGHGHGGGGHHGMMP